MKQNSQRRIRIAVVGCGSQMTNNLLPALQLQDVEITAVCDINAQNLQRISNAFRVERSYHSFDRLLEEEAIDGVCIAVGSEKHAALVRSALRKGVRVFVEKPPAISAEEASTVQKLSEETSTQVMVGFNKRFAPAYRAVMQIGRRAGERRPLAVAIRATCVQYATDQDLLRDFAIHYVDLARYFLGKVKSVHALRFQVEAGASAYCVNMEAASGGIAQLFLTSLDSWANPSEHVFIQWKNQAIEVNNVVELVNRRKSADLRMGWSDDFASTVNQCWQPNFTAPNIVNNSIFLKGYLGEIAQFTNMVALGLPANPSIRDAVADLRVLESVTQSLDSGMPVAVNLLEQG